jgi:hypothetical protein
LHLYAYAQNTTEWVDPLELAKHSPTSAYCQQEKIKIENIEKDLDKHWKELAPDEQDLPEHIGPGEDFRETRRSHRTIINSLDILLRAREKEHDDERREKCN